MNLSIGENLIIALAVVWAVLWKCYSVWIAARNGHKKWFVALVIFNTFGILDMIYIFAVAKKKWEDIKNLFANLTKTISSNK